MNEGLMKLKAWSMEMVLGYHEICHLASFYHKLYKGSACSHRDVTHWFVDDCEALSLAFQPSATWFFGAKREHIWTKV